MSIFGIARLFIKSKEETAASTMNKDINTFKHLIY
jgi:hypothetical protein